MNALLLSAGLGTRLMPITNNTPKCLVPINGRVLMNYWLEQLTNAGVERFLINTHYLSDEVNNFILSSEYYDRIDISHEKKLLNTAGTLLDNKAYFCNEAFMMVHADNLSLCNFSDFINAHKTRPTGTEITMMTFETDAPKSCGIVEIDQAGIVYAFHEKKQNPPSSLANAAVYIVEPSVLDFIGSIGKKNLDFSLDILPNFLGKINTFFNNVYHRDIGTLESYARAQIELYQLSKEDN